MRSFRPSARAIEPRLGAIGGESSMSSVGRRGYQRKYALRPLNGLPPGAERPRRRRSPRHVRTGSDPGVDRDLGSGRVSLVAAAEGVAAVVAALAPLAARPVGHGMPAAAADQPAPDRSAPRPDQAPAPARRYGRINPGTLLKRHIHLKIDHWDVTGPGFTEVDLVAHAGHLADGECAPTRSTPPTSIRPGSRPGPCWGAAKATSRRPWRRSGRSCPSGCAGSIRTTGRSSSTTILPVRPRSGDPVHARAPVQEG